MASEEKYTKTNDTGYRAGDHAYQEKESTRRPRGLEPIFSVTSRRSRCWFPGGSFISGRLKRGGPFHVALDCWEKQKLSGPVRFGSFPNQVFKGISQFLDYR